jgi:hypothetical protein
MPTRCCRKKAGPGETILMKYVNNDPNRNQERQRHENKRHIQNPLPSRDGLEGIRSFTPWE